MSDPSAAPTDTPRTDEDESDLSALRKENEALKEDAERLDWLIQQAYSGLNEELREPHAVGLVIGGKVEWPDGVRATIDEARKP